MAAFVSNYNNITTVQNRLRIRPDQVFIYSANIPLLKGNDLMRFRTETGFTEPLNTIADLSRLFSDRPLSMCLIRADGVTVCYSEDRGNLNTLISNIEVKIMSREDAETLLNSKEITDENTLYIIRRYAFLGLVISVRSIREIRHYLEYRVLPYNNDGSRNVDFFTRLFSMDPANPAYRKDLLYDSVMTLYHKYAHYIGPENVHVVFNTDLPTDKLATFDRMTDRSLLYIIGECNPDGTITSDIFPLTLNGTRISKPPITPNEINLIVGYKRVVVALYDNYNTNNMASLLSDELNGIIIISNRSHVDMETTMLSFYTDHNSFLTFWSSSHQMSLNIPINFFDIDTSRLFRDALQ